MSMQTPILCIDDMDKMSTTQLFVFYFFLSFLRINVQTLIDLSDCEFIKDLDS